MNRSNSENRIIKGIVCYRNEDGSFADDIEEIYLDEPTDDDLTEYEKTKLGYFTEKVLAPLFMEYARTLNKRGKAHSNKQKGEIS